MGHVDDGANKILRSGNPTSEQATRHDRMHGDKRNQYTMGITPIREDWGGEPTSTRPLPRRGRTTMASNKIADGIHRPTKNSPINHIRRRSLWPHHPNQSQNYRRSKIPYEQRTAETKTELTRKLRQFNTNGKNKGDRGPGALFPGPRRLPRLTSKDKHAKRAPGMPPIGGIGYRELRTVLLRGPGNPFPSDQNNLTQMERRLQMHQNIRPIPKPRQESFHPIGTRHELARRRNPSYRQWNGQRTRQKLRIPDLRPLDRPYEPDRLGNMALAHRASRIPIILLFHTAPLGFPTTPHGLDIR